MFQNFTIFIEKQSKSRYSQFFLSIVAFIESIFFPIPPDIILIPIIYFNKNKFILTVLNCTFFSVLGGVIGYLIGFIFFDLVKNYINISKQETFLNFYNHWGYMAIFLGGFTPIPYKIIAITSGYSKFNFLVFILLSLISRGLRFIIIGYIVSKFGDLGIAYLKKNKFLIFLILPLIIVGISILVLK